jgi:hypothetical protein
MNWRCECRPGKDRIAHQNAGSKINCLTWDECLDGGAQYSTNSAERKPGFASMALRSASYSLLIPSLAHQR